MTGSCGADSDTRMLSSRHSGRISTTMSSTSCRRSTAPGLGSAPLRAIRCSRRDSSPMAWFARSARGDRLLVLGVDAGHRAQRHHRDARQVVEIVRHRRGQLADRAHARFLHQQILRAHEVGVELLEALQEPRAFHGDAEVAHERAQQTVFEQFVGQRLAAEIRAQPQCPYRLIAAAQQRPAGEGVAAQVLEDYARQRHGIGRDSLGVIFQDQQRFRVRHVDHAPLAKPVANGLAHVEDRDPRHLVGRVAPVDELAHGDEVPRRLIQHGDPDGAEAEGGDLVRHQRGDVVQIGHGRQSRRHFGQ